MAIPFNPHARGCLVSTARVLGDLTLDQRRGPSWQTAWHDGCDVIMRRGLPAGQLQRDSAPLSPGPSPSEDLLAVGTKMAPLPPPPPIVTTACSSLAKQDWDYPSALWDTNRIVSTSRYPMQIPAFVSDSSRRPGASRGLQNLWWTDGLPVRMLAAVQPTSFEPISDPGFRGQLHFSGCPPPQTSAVTY